MMDQQYLTTNGKQRTGKSNNYDMSAETCDAFKVQVFERLIVGTDRIGYIDEGAEVISGSTNYATTSPFWIIADGRANLVKFNEMFVSNGARMVSELGAVLNRVTPMLQYSKRRVISNGSFYENKWVFNATKNLLMVELGNGTVMHYRTTLQELFQSTTFDRYDDGAHDVEDYDVKMETGDELYIYRDYGVLILVFDVVREHTPLRPLEYVMAAFCPRPASICLAQQSKK